MDSDFFSHFPVICSIEEMMQSVGRNQSLKQMFNSWLPEERMCFIQSCTGGEAPNMRVPNILREVIRLDLGGHRISSLLSALLGESVEVLHASFPNLDGDQEKECLIEATFKMENDSLGHVAIYNVHVVDFHDEIFSTAPEYVQKTKSCFIDKEYYAFHRYAKHDTIYLFEHTPAFLKSYPQQYLHYGCLQTTVEDDRECVHENCYVILDQFRKHVESEGIANEQEAWLAFLSITDASLLGKMLSDYPQLLVLYREFYKACYQTEKIMCIFEEAFKNAHKRNGD